MIHFGSYRMIQNGSSFFRMITIEQIRAARGLLGWSQTELANRAGLSLPTVKRVEAGTGPRVSDEARTRIQKALEAGVGLVHYPKTRVAPGWAARIPNKTQTQNKHTP